MDDGRNPCKLPRAPNTCHCACVRVLSREREVLTVAKSGTKSDLELGEEND